MLNFTFAVSESEFSLDNKWLCHQSLNISEHDNVYSYRKWLKSEVVTLPPPLPLIYSFPFQSIFYVLFDYFLSFLLFSDLSFLLVFPLLLLLLFFVNSDVS